jgi:hypothetical protein
MHKYEFAIYGIADRTNYNNRRNDLKSIAEALEEISRMSEPAKYLVTKTEFTRIFDDTGIFQRETIQTTKIDCSIWEVRYCDEIGHDYHDKYFPTFSAACDHMNTRERYEQGWHYYHIEIKL